MSIGKGCGTNHWTDAACSLITSAAGLVVSAFAFGLKNTGFECVYFELLRDTFCIDIHQETMMSTIALNFEIDL